MRVGGVEIELIHGRGETDDATFVWLPQARVLVSGDFVIWVFPNAGNPRKVQRYAPDWAAACGVLLLITVTDFFLVIRRMRQGSRYQPGRYVPPYDPEDPAPPHDAENPAPPDGPENPSPPDGRQDRPHDPGNDGPPPGERGR